eukprot:PLAT3544.1.p2 GENE.PLAT3544.1~~PLAT3544.1.p2  ORF type:complete len:1162 (+),score=712.35 PLAT3544.1:31-3486(+)
MASDFLNEDNLCGQSLLRLVARGNSILAEMLRLSKNVPSIFLGKAEDLSQEKYAGVLADFTYLRSRDKFERRIAADQDLIDTDEELAENHMELLERFYTLFSSIVSYHEGWRKFLDNLLEGFHIAHTVESVTLDVDGRQLMCEAVYLFGIMLLFLDELIPGPARERLVISYYRNKGETTVRNFDDVCALVKSTGFVPGGKKLPRDYPESYFARFDMDSDVLDILLSRLRSDDVYLAMRSYPAPRHRSTALAAQASMLYVLLFFMPRVLKKESSMMREIVDKHFNDNWVIALYMGKLVDVSAEWKRYRAASAALKATVKVEHVRELADRARREVIACEGLLRDYLTEGVLLEQYVIDNITPLLNCLRRANVTLRWLLLHRRSVDRRTREAVERESVEAVRIVLLLMATAQLEFTLKGMLEALLLSKEDKWAESKAACSSRMEELAAYFSAEVPLARVEKNEDLQAWFTKLKLDIEELGYNNSTVAGRKIQSIIGALEDVEQFEEIDTSLQIKQFLEDTRDYLVRMVRLVNVRGDILAMVDTVTDFSYAWELIHDYTPILHERVRRNPGTVPLLRSLFSKLASILDVPLIRINQCNSSDTISVAEYYSGELVGYVREVMKVVPESMFTKLTRIIALQSGAGGAALKPLPVRLEQVRLKEFAQLQLRYDLARATHEISVFTEGILAMEKTLLGLEQVDPRAILEDGIRTELVRRISRSMHMTLQFKHFTHEEVHSKFAALARELDAFKRSFEYIQDYITMYALRIWQQEVSRIINYNVEQEANLFLAKKVFDAQSKYQSAAIRVPRFPSTDGTSINFMGRLVRALLALTDPRGSVYAPKACGWYALDTGDERVGISTFSQIKRSVGVTGLSGIDRLVSFRIVHELRRFLTFYGKELKPHNALLHEVVGSLQPTHKLPDSPRLYSTALKKLNKLMDPMLRIVLRVGQLQLMRRQITNELSFSSKLDSQLLTGALRALNSAVLKDVWEHYRNPEKPYPSAENPLLEELARYMEATGFHNPLAKIYVTTDALDNFTVLLFLFVLANMKRLVYDRAFSTLVRRKASDGVDGVPFLVGVLTILRQFHPLYTHEFFAYLGQFVRSSIFAAFSKRDESRVHLPEEVVNVLLFADQFCRLGYLPRSLVEKYIPSYIFDAVHM